MGKDQLSAVRCDCQPCGVPWLLVLTRLATNGLGVELRVRLWVGWRYISHCCVLRSRSCSLEHRWSIGRIDVLSWLTRCGGNFYQIGGALRDCSVAGYCVGCLSGLEGHLPF